MGIDQLSRVHLQSLMHVIKNLPLVVCLFVCTGAVRFAHAGGAPPTRPKRALPDQSSSKPASTKTPSPKTSSRSAVAYAEIQAIFDRYCSGCHNDKMPQGGLSLASFEALSKGGAHGAVITPGKASTSAIIQALDGTRKPRMPLNSPPLADATIKRIRLWIDGGARAGPVSGASPPLVAPPPPSIPTPRVDVDIPTLLNIPKDKELTFTGDILSIFEANCLGCHGPENPRVGLRLTSFESLMAGGESGPPVRPGKSSDSLLVKRIEGTVGRKMPLNGSLKQEEIDRIKAWIDQGARPGLPDAAKEPQTVIAIGPLSPPTAIAFSPDGRWLAMGYFRRLVLIELPSGVPVKVLSDHAGTIQDIEFSVDGKQIAAAGGEPGKKGEIKIWDTEKWNLLKTLDGHTDSVYSVAFTTDGKRLVSGSNDKTVRLWDLSEGKLLETFKDAADAVYAVAISPDGNLVAGGGADKTIKIWKVGGGLQRTLTQTSDAVTSVSFSPDGKQVIGAGMDGVVRRWLSEDGKNVANMGHGDKVLDMAQARDGKTIVSVGADRNAKVWNESNSLVRTLGGHTDWIFSACVSTDGKMIATGSGDGSVRLYSGADGRWLATLLFPPPSGPSADFRWVYVTPEGYYDGSADILPLVRWKIRGMVRTGEPFQSKLHQPEMVKKALMMQPVEPPVITTENNPEKSN